MAVRDRFRRGVDVTWGRLGPGGRRVIGFAALALVMFGLGLAWGSWKHMCDTCPSIAQIYAFEAKEATKLYAADGTLLTELAVERRTPISIDSIPPHVYEAFVAVEDRRFWKHGGIDLLRTIRAVIDFAFQGYDAAGGSSITQQLAGNMFTGAVDRRDISVRRKLREMRVSFALEKAYSKREILQAYLNQINFDGVYGIQAAARRYFGKDASELNLPEAATLAAMPVSPRRHNPARNPDRSVRRRNLILGLMSDQGKITDQEANAARAYPLELAETATDRDIAAYFVEWVRQILYDRYGTDIYSRGYHVYTTLDPAMQAVADSAVRAQLEWVEGQGGFHAPTYAETREWPEDSLAAYGTEMPYVQGMFVAMDPQTGDVRAMVGGRDFDDSEFNRAIQARRQPGSVFKPFVYTAAIAAGIPASEVIYDTPIQIEQPGQPVYSPRNFTNEFSGPITLRRALAQSVNVVAVKLGQRVGEASFAQMAHSMGVESEVPLVPSAAIGAGEVTPIEITTAYTTFATLGTRVAPRAILRIEDNEGRVVWESSINREAVLEPRVAWIMNSMLRDVVDRGTGQFAVRSQAGVPYDIPVAGKTGTTNGSTNTWFVAFTPEIVTASWVGFDRPDRIFFNATGGLTAAPVGGAVLGWYYRDRESPPEWPRPMGLIGRSVDRTTGLISTPWCPADLVYNEWYLPGTEPNEACDIHGPWGTADPADSLGLRRSDKIDW